MTGPRELVTVAAAARRVNRPRRTVRNWIDRGLLYPVGLDVDGTALYDLAVVRRLAVTTATRRRR